MSIENESIATDIASYNKNINNFRYQSNIQGIWLFTATLGCWSVNIPWVQMIASLSLLLIFFFLINDEDCDKRTFRQIKKDIENKIESSLSGDTRMARLYELASVEKNRVSPVVIIKKSPIFIVCYIFYALSLVHFAGIFIDCYTLK
ncbi:hypothetical protein [Raoultella planticola]|uniref:hypothetical protein n=1 Tax=Raoultella planticola TaxID=575 RepID=UPI0029CAA654|nr:hypothetical protein [Raoultella planticola]WPJ15641.1 hypothetical protein SH586_15505 [Raoultella planticola]